MSAFMAVSMRYWRGGADPCIRSGVRSRGGRLVEDMAARKHLKKKDNAKKKWNPIAEGAGANYWG